MWCSCSPWCVTGNMSKYLKCDMNENVFFLLFFFSSNQVGSCWASHSISTAAALLMCCQNGSTWEKLSVSACGTIWTAGQKKGKNKTAHRGSAGGGMILFILFSFLTDFQRKCEVSFSLESPASLCKSDLCQSLSFKQIRCSTEDSGQIWTLL